MNGSPPYRFRTPLAKSVIIKYYLILLEKSIA